MKTYIVRHTQTQWNKEKRLQGWEDSPLTEEGKAVAHMIGERLTEKGIARICTSDLGRCKTTASIINEHLHVPITEHQELREQNYGEYGGKPRSYLIKLHENPEIAPPKGESFAHMERRVVGFLESVKDDNVLIITHGGCARGILSHLLKRSANDEECGMRQDEIVTIERTATDWGGKVKVHREEA